MTISLGSTVFDRVHYDAEADVLYLNVEGAEPALWDESPEGHFLRFDADGRLCGLTLVDVQHQLDQDGTVKVTVPCPQELGVDDLGLALQTA
jgi:uncharacterized protein YuzE